MRSELISLLITRLYFVKSWLPPSFCPAATSFSTYLRTHLARLLGSQRCRPDDAGQKRPDSWRQPFAITMGEQGAFWCTRSNSNKVARIIPNGSIRYARTPSLSNPAFITPGLDGNIWFGEGSTDKIASVAPNGVIAEYQFSFFGHHQRLR